MSGDIPRLSTFIWKEFQDKRELSDLALRKVMASMSEASDKGVEQREVLRAFTKIACEEENKFKSKKNKRTVMEYLGNIYSKKMVLNLIKSTPEVMDTIFKVLMLEQEDYAIILTKVVQDYMLHSFAGNSKDFNMFFASFYDVLEEKTKLFKEIDNEEWRKNAKIVPDAKKIPQKEVKMRYSLKYYADIMTHIMMLIDEKRLVKNQDLVNRVKCLLEELLTGFVKIKIEPMSQSMHKIYFRDLLYVINKSLTWISRLLSKNKSHRLPMGKGYNQANPQYKIMDHLAQFIEDKTKGGKDLIKVVIDLLKVSHIGSGKQKFDCFLNIKSYVALYPKSVMEYLDVILDDSFFKERRNNWSVSEVNNIYYCWIYAQKSMIKTGMTSDRKKVCLIEAAPRDTLNKLLENLVGIIFDRRTFPNFVVNALNHLKNLVDILNRSYKGGYHKSHNNLLLKILQKVVIQMKIIRNNHMEIIEFLQMNGGSEAIKSSKIKEQELFNDIPRYEDYETEEKFNEVVDKYLEEDDVNLETAFFCNSNQRTYISPLLEDEEGLVINSIVISPNSKKLSLFIDENILMRIGLLNEISSKIFKEIMSSLYIESRKSNQHNVYPNRPAHLNLPIGSSEYYLLKKVYKYNLQIYYQLTIKSALTSFKELNDPLRFDISFIEMNIREMKTLLKLDIRQLYFMIDSNIVIILKILKNLVKLGADTYPQYFQQFFDIFSGTNSHKPEDNSGLYMYTIFCEILIKNLMNLIDKLPEKLDKFHFLYDGELNIHVFILKVLKYIFRTIRLKENANQEYATTLIMRLKHHIFKLILIIIKLTSEQIYPIDYLFLMKIIFKTIVRCDHFFSFFTNEITSKGIRILEFFIMLFKTGIEELKILSTELTLFIPLEIKNFLVKYPEFAKDFIPMITYALALQESFVILRAIQTLDHIINSSSMLKVEVLHLLEPHAAQLLKNLDELMIYHKKKSYFFKSSTNLESFIIPASLKILAKLSPFIRQLDIQVKFNFNKDYQIALDEGFSTFETQMDPRKLPVPLRGGIDSKEDVEGVGPDTNRFRFNDPELDDFGGGDESGGKGGPKTGQNGAQGEDEEGLDGAMVEERIETETRERQINELFQIYVDGYEGKKFKFDTTQTLIAVFKTIEKLAKKPTLYYYFSISPNLLFVSTLKHRLGIQKIYNFLRHIFDALAFDRNDDIEKYILEEEASDDSMQEESYYTQALKTISKRSSSSCFLIQKVLECTLQVLNFLHPFKSERDQNAEVEHLKNLMYSLMEKSLTAPAQEGTHLRHNLIALMCTLISLTRHQLTLSRETPENKHFNICTGLITTFLKFSQKHDPGFARYFFEFIFQEMIKHLYFNDLKTGIGAVYFLKDLFGTKEYKELVTDNLPELLHSIFVFLNKLPPQFNFEIQNTCIELCRNIIKFFITENKKKDDYVAKLKELTSKLMPLIVVNQSNQQKLLITILNIVFTKVDEKTLFKLILCEDDDPSKEINLKEMLSDKKYAEINSPFYQVVSYAVNTIKNFTFLIKNRGRLIGAFKHLTHKQLAKLHNMIMVLTHFFKLKINLKVFDGDRFEETIEIILKGLMLFVKENEDYNEKKMDLRGSSVRVNTLEQHITNPPVSREGNAPPRAFQPYRVNNKIYFQDLENNIHIDDHDFYIKAWSKLIESVVTFFAYFLTRKKIHQKIKQSQEQFRKKVAEKKSLNTNEDPYPNEILRLRDKIIMKMFELLSRVEKKIRQSVNTGFKYLLSFETQIKEIMHEDKLVSCFRPLLSCLQLHDLQMINENTLYSFRKLFKLFHSCFNKPRLFEKLIQYLENFRKELKSDNRPLNYSYFQLINSIFVLFTKMITNEDLKRIMMIGLEIESNLQSKRIYSFSLKPVLMKVINQQSSSRVISFLKRNISNNPCICFDFLLETLKQDQSHPFRERISREELSTFLIHNQLNQGTHNGIDSTERIFRWTKLIRILSRKIPSWLVMKKQIIDFYAKRLDGMIAEIKTSRDLCQLSEPKLKNHFIITLKIMVEYCKHENSNTDYIFTFLKVVSLKINDDFGFIYKFFKYTLPQKYHLDSQKKIFLMFIRKLKGDGKDSQGEQDSIRLANHIIILPILHNMFKSERDVHILSYDVVQELRTKIKELHDRQDYEAWVLVEMTLLLDYIVAKTNHTEKHPGFAEFLEDVLIFAWRNIGSPRENNMLLKNMSKLLVSRLISRFNMLSEKIGYINQLYRSIVYDLDNIIDDETKHIWIKTCKILLPEIKKFNFDFKENKDKKENYWLEIFISGIDGANSMFSGFSKEIPNLYNRYWNSIIINRKIIEGSKNILIEGNKFYSMLNSFISSEKQPTILLDILLLFITWYINDLVKAKKEGRSTEKILGINPQKEEFLINMLLELVKRDENSCGVFLNRAYYLLRKYLLVFRKSKYNSDALYQLMRSRRTSHLGSNEEMIHSYKRLRMNFVVMNIILAFLHHPIPKDSEEVFTKRICDFVLTELLQKDSKNYTKFPYLIPLSYQIIKRIIHISSPIIQVSYLNTIYRKASDSVEFTVKNYKERGNNPNDNLVSLWVAILLLKLIYEFKPRLLVSITMHLYDLIKIFIEYLIKKSVREDEKTAEFDENRDILQKFFICENIDPYPEINPSPRNYYKGYSILILRILVFHIAEFAKNWKQKNVIPVFQSILQKVGYSDYDIKIEALMLIRCLVLPETVTSPVYAKLTKSSKIFKRNEKIQIFLKLEPESFLTSKETENKGYRLFATKYWELMIEFLEHNRNSTIINEFLRKLSLINNSGLTIQEKDRLMNKINSFADGGFYSKFMFLANPELTKTYIYSNMRIHEVIKKMNLFTGADFIQRGKLSSTITTKITGIYNSYFEGQEDYMLTEERKKELTQSVNIKTQQGKVIKKKQQLIFDDLDEEIRYRVTKFKQSLSSHTSIQFFNTYRDILDMDNFEEYRNTYTFWSSYIIQTWKQNTEEENTRLWLYLNDFTHFGGNCLNDYLFCLLTLKEITFPFMLTEQMRILTKKVLNPLVPVYFIEELHERVRKNPELVQEKDSIVYNFYESLNELNEGDLAAGVLKMFSRKEKQKRMITAVQTRRWLDAEEFCEELIEDMEFVDSANQDFEFYIDKFIVEECWLSVQKNLNEWQKVHELALNTERRDAIFESSYFLQKADQIKKLSATSAESENPLSYVYYMSIRLMDQRYFNEQIDKNVSKKLKEILYISLINEWYILPKVFSEKHKAQLALSHYCLEFEEGWDLIQLLKKHNEINELPKIKDEVLYFNLICRERTPHSSMGILACKKIFEQRSLISHVLNTRMEELLGSKQSVLSIKVDDMKKANIFNETYHNAIRYCEVERKFGVYSTIFNISKQIETVPLSSAFASQNDEFLYVKEKLKLWAVDEEQTEVPANIMDRLKDENLNKDLRSDLRCKIMYGFLLKNNLEAANENGLEALKLNEENWKAWRVWFTYYRKLCYSVNNTHVFLDYLKEMIDCFKKSIKLKSHRTLLLFSEVIKLVMEKKEFFRGTNKDKYIEVIKKFKTLLKDCPVWIWMVWLPNMIIQFIKYRSTCGLDEFVYEATKIASKVYPEWTQNMLSIFIDSHITNPVLEEILEKLKSSNLNRMKSHDQLLTAMSAIYERLCLETPNDYQDAFYSIYESGQIDSRTTNEIVTKCKDMKKGYGQFKNQDNSQKILSLVEAVDGYIKEMRIKKRGKVRIGLDNIPLSHTTALPVEYFVYREKSIRHCMRSHYLVPELDIVYEGRKFKLELSFSSNDHKKSVYTFEKRAADKFTQYLVNHYTKLLNVQLLKHPETVYRDIKFKINEILFLEDDFCLKKKFKSEQYIIDLLDKELNRNGLIGNHPIQLLAEKKDLMAVNDTMKELIDQNFLKRCVVKKLNSPFDMFYWRKRYSQYLAMNCMKSLIFVNDTDFEQLRISFKQGRIIDDSLEFRLDDLAKTKNLQMPLRLTPANLELIREHMIEGAIVPTLMSMGNAFKMITLDFDYSVVMNLFIRDFYSKSSEEKINVEKFVNSTMANYFMRVVKMTNCYRSDKSSSRLKYKEMNSLMEFMELMEDEEYQNELPLGYRAWV